MAPLVLSQALERRTARQSAESLLLQVGRESARLSMPIPGRSRPLRRVGGGAKEEDETQIRIGAKEVYHRIGVTTTQSCGRVKAR